jgi:hypothetical protein
MKIEVEEFLDKTLSDFFPKDGCWKSNCFRKSDFVAEENLPCHIRDNNWLSQLILKKYDLYSLGKATIMDYIANSEYFNKLRWEYEQKIVSWQIDWMLNDGENWICEDDLYIFSNRCDEIFRNGIFDTLSAIGINTDAIEEGIEKNVDKWREGYMSVAFYNLYFRPHFRLYGTEEYKILTEPSQEHYEKWRKVRLYKYYLAHKKSVDKYGEVLPEMLMTEEEVLELERWLNEEHGRRMKEIDEYNKERNNYESSFPINPKIDFYGCDFPDEEDLEKEYNPTQKDKVKSLVRRIFGGKK